MYISQGTFWDTGIPHTFMGKTFAVYPGRTGAGTFEKWGINERDFAREQPFIFS